MLSAESKDVIRATLPAVGAEIDEIAPLFYRKMFAAHPELERDLFNRGNQKQGEQQKALAGSIAGFATMQLDPDPARMELMLLRIAHKHASLGITADQYQIVHTHLFEAIVEVLGDAVTPDVAAAWDELYWLMAHSLISREKVLYTDAGRRRQTRYRSFSPREVPKGYRPSFLANTSRFVCTFPTVLDRFGSTVCARRRKRTTGASPSNASKRMPCPT